MKRKGKNERRVSDKNYEHLKTDGKRKSDEERERDRMKEWLYILNI